MTNPPNKNPKPYLSIRVTTYSISINKDVHVRNNTNNQSKSYQPPSLNLQFFNTNQKMSNKTKDTAPSVSDTPTSTTTTLDTSDSPSTKEKKSWYRRYVDTKTGNPIDDDELKRYTGMSKAELEEWAQNRAGVAGNQAAGKLTVGPATGLGGYETSQGYGGWGGSGEGVKFPPLHGGKEEKKG